MTPRKLTILLPALLLLGASAAVADPDAETAAAIQRHFAQSAKDAGTTASPAKAEPTESPEALVNYFTTDVPEDITVAARRPHVDLDITFDFDSADLNKDGIAQLDTAGQALNDPRLASRRFMLGGHTDDLGDAEYNRELSEKRAESAKRYLIEVYDIDPARLETAGFGSQHPKDPRHTPEARKRNRRVVLEMIE